jgi:hypothetical protein
MFRLNQSYKKAYTKNSCSDEQSIHVSAQHEPSNRVTWLAMIILLTVVAALTLEQTHPFLIERVILNLKCGVIRFLSEFEFRVQSVLGYCANCSFSCIFGIVVTCICLTLCVVSAYACY